MQLWGNNPADKFEFLMILAVNSLGIYGNCSFWYFKYPGKLSPDTPAQYTGHTGSGISGQVKTGIAKHP